MQVVEFNIIVRPWYVIAISQVIVKLIFGWHRGCAAMSGNNQSATSVRVTQCLLIAFVIEPAAQEAGDKRITGAKYIEYFNSNSSDCCLLYTSPSPRDLSTSRMPSSA